MVHFILLFCVVLRKREYVTTYIEDGIISMMKPSKNTFTSRLAFNIYNTPVVFSVKCNYISNPIKTNSLCVFIWQHLSKSFTKLWTIHQSTFSLIQRFAVATYHTNIHHHPLGTSLQYLYQ